MLKEGGPVNKIDINTLGNILAGLALAFLIDSLALKGAVAASLPEGVVAIVGFVIFGGAVVYGYKQAKKLN